MVDTARIVQLFSEFAIHEKPRKIVGALPGFETALVNIGLDVGITEAGRVVG